jgi:hypothetical protein
MLDLPKPAPGEARSETTVRLNSSDVEYDREPEQAKVDRGSVAAAPARSVYIVIGGWPFPFCNSSHG